MGKRLAMIQEAIGLGLVFSFFYVELVGLSAGGLIVPGYLAIYWDNPYRIGATLLVALVSYLVIKVISNYTILFSRRRFLATVLVGFILGYFLDVVMFRVPAGYQDLRAIGFIIPGLIANDMVKQGVVNTTVSVLLISALVRLVLLGIN